MGVELKGISEVNSRVGQSKGTITKVLGILWNAVKDQLIVKGLKPTQSSQSKREVLKSIATVYDPLGVFTLANLQGKRFLQDLWKRKNGMRN